MIKKLFTLFLFGMFCFSFMPISAQGEENLAKGLFEHKGVQIHPGDKGMKMLADRYIEELKKIL